MSLTGHYILKTNENVDAWMAAIGTDSKVIKKALNTKTLLDVKQEGNDITMISDVEDGMKSRLSFSLGQRCTWGTAGGQDYKVRMYQDGNRYKGTYQYNGHIGDTTIECLPDSLVQTYTQGKVTARKVYKRQ